MGLRLVLRRGGAARRLMSSGVWSPALGSQPPRREASRSCAVNAKSWASSQPGAADGVLNHGPMRRQQIIYSLIPVRVPGAGEWRGLGVGWSPRPLSRSRGHPSPARGLGPRTHTHFLTISEHTLAARPPAAPQLLSPARRAQSCRCAALLRLPAARRRRGAWRAGGPAAGPGLGGRKREAEEK